MKVTINLKCDVCGESPSRRKVSVTVPGRVFERDGYDAVEAALGPELEKHLRNSEWIATLDGQDICNYHRRR